MEKKGNLDYSKRQTVLDDVGYVPEDSVMDFGQTTIDDLNKVEVNFHVWLDKALLFIYSDLFRI